MSTKKLLQVPEKFASQANITAADYKKLYQESIQTPDTFWGKQSERLSWFKKWDEVIGSGTNFAQANIQWFTGGKLNACYNCIDRHLDGPVKDKTAIVWKGDDPNESKTFTYQELYQEVCSLALILKQKGIQKGDRVLIYLPMIPELVFSVLACARIGAVHSVVFGGFSAESLAGRIQDSKPSLVITSDAGYRCGQVIKIKKNIDDALNKLASHTVKSVIVVERVGKVKDLVWNSDRDFWQHELKKNNPSQETVPPEEMDSEDPLFILYTSGSTGKPKGVQHTTAGYLLGANLSFHYIFDHKPEDIFWCTADIGWITGHSYIIYGPLSNGATSVMFEGAPTYPDPGRFWEIIDQCNVSIFYTAPTAIRSLMKESIDYVERYSLQSLRLLGTVGEPINPEVWEWYHTHIGKENCPIVDTWWQTETGSILITPLPGATPLKPGSAGWPFFGVELILTDNDGNKITTEGRISGNLCIASPWPSMMRGVYGDQGRFYATYFSQFPGYYFTGDGVLRDEDGYYWITGRVDDVINVSGHRIGSAEVESALLEHTLVAEAAVVGFPHDIKGQAIYAYVTLKSYAQPSEELKKELIQTTAENIGKIARPEVIHWTPSLPKTRSGKIMRRILRKIAEGDTSSLGDITTLAEPGVVHDLIQGREV